ncbi:MAG: type II secretion system F family protein [Puniceicoccales bacterium]|jgi:type II secretory pathway component PulF|nr:type II secretion system F family protein [Puniceicoccales bacterium]
MVKFAYKGMNPAMKSVSGTIDAGDRKSAIAMLRAQGVNVTSLQEGSGATAKKSAFSFSLRSSNSKMALNFLQKFLQLHGGGLAIGDTIKVMRMRLKNPQEKQLAETIHKDVCEGKSIAAAMRNFPNVFNDNTVCMIEAGEKTGNLVSVIRNLIDFLETKEGIKKKFIAGMAYPATVCVIGLAVTLIFLFLVMPKLQNMLKSLGGELPAIAQCLVAVSDFAFKYWWVVLIGILVVFFGFFAYKSTPTGKFNVHKWSLNIPIVGIIIKENFYCQTANLLSTLLGSGINTTEAMTLAENASENLYFRKRFIESKKLVLDGVSMTQSFEQNKIFPDLGLDLLAVGENTGDLATSFREVFKIYHTALLDHLNLMTTAVTAIAMGAAFAMVAVLALSVISSVMKMTSSMKM